MGFKVLVISRFLLATSSNAAEMEKGEKGAVLFITEEACYFKRVKVLPPFGNESTSRKNELFSSDLHSFMPCIIVATEVQKIVISFLVMPFFRTE